MERISQTFHRGRDSLSNLISRVASESLELVNGIFSSEQIRMHSQIVCSGCRTLLLYPAGATTVQCGACNTVTGAYPQGGGMDQIVCGGCRTPLMYNRGATSVRCACCQTVTPITTETDLALVICGHCNTTLMYPRGSDSVRCSRCNYVTSISSGAGSTPIAGPRPEITQMPQTATQASSQANNVTVVVENPMTVDEGGKLVSNVAVGITSGKK